jgi:AAA15 family ATPase/GTPase
LNSAIKAISMKNFKSLKDSGRVALKPITILVGPNNSGKSSFIQLLLILKQTLESGSRDTPLVISGKYVSLGSYKDIIFGNEVSNSIELSFEIDSTKLNVGNCKLEYIFEYDDQNELIILKEVNYSIPTVANIRILEVKVEGREGTYAQRIYLYNQDHVKVHETPFLLKKLHFMYDLEDIFDMIQRRDEYLEQLSKIDTIEKSYQDFLNEPTEYNKKNREKYLETLEEVKRVRYQTNDYLDKIN